MVKLIWLHGSQAVYLPLEKYRKTTYVFLNNKSIHTTIFTILFSTAKFVIFMIDANKGIALLQLQLSHQQLWKRLLKTIVPNITEIELTNMLVYKSNRLSKPTVLYLYYPHITCIVLIC